MSKKIENLEWSEEKGETISVNFNNEKITTSTGRELPFFDHIVDVKWVIENNLNALRGKIERFQQKLDVTELTRIPIKDGYKLLEPLDDTQRERYSRRIVEMTEEVSNIVVLEEKYNG